jgi:uncharacterized membrane protein YdfJ with MMPL/SSD domain
MLGFLAGYVRPTGQVADATVVRLVLVPALMELLGWANWWLPAWLARLLPAGRPEAGRVVEPAAAPADVH